MQSTSSNWLAIVVAIIAGLTPFVVGEQLKTWFGLSDSGINIVRGVFAVIGVVVTAYNGLQIQKKQ